MSKDDLSFAYRVDGDGARRRKRSNILRLMIRALNEPGLLDEHGLNVTWKWRNTEAQDMREADFDTAVSESRSGFITLMRRRLERDLSRVLDVEDAMARHRREIAPPPEPPKRKRKRSAPRARKAPKRKAVKRGRKR